MSEHGPHRDEFEDSDHSDHSDDSETGSTEPAGGWRQLAAVPTDAEARLVQGCLESRGIVCHLESLYFTQEPVRFGLLGGVRVHVAESDLEGAREVLEKLAIDVGDGTDSSEEADPSHSST